MSSVRGPYLTLVKKDAIKSLFYCNGRIFNSTLATILMFNFLNEG